MKIALFGYGKMGKTIEKIAEERGHKIMAKFDKDFSEGELSKAEVAIDFSVPDVAYSNIEKALDFAVPIVSGTTGWLDKYEDAVAYCKKKNGAFIYSSNFSLGVNLFFELNKKLAQMMNGFETYSVSMEETHHSQKLDAPSGTAITLAEGIIKNTDYEKWELGVTDSNRTIPIQAIREAEVPGTHKVRYSSKIDELEIIHTAKTRQGFALGAIVAAEWIRDKRGVFNMKDVIGL